VSNLALAEAATSTLAAAEIGCFHEQSRHHSPEVEALRKAFAAGLAGCAEDARFALAPLGDDFDIAAWLIHRLSKLQSRAFAGSGARLGS